MISDRRISKLTQRDMPMICLLVAAWAGLATVGCFLLAALADEPPPYGELVAVSGRVTNTFLKKIGKGHSQIHLLSMKAWSDEKSRRVSALRWWAELSAYLQSLFSAWR